MHQCEAGQTHMHTWSRSSVTAKQIQCYRKADPVLLPQDLARRAKYKLSKEKRLTTFRNLFSKLSTTRDYKYYVRQPQRFSTHAPWLLPGICQPQRFSAHAPRLSLAWGATDWQKPQPHIFRAEAPIKENKCSSLYMQVTNTRFFVWQNLNSLGRAHNQVLNISFEESWPVSKEFLQKVQSEKSLSQNGMYNWCWKQCLNITNKKQYPLHNRYICKGIF